MTTTTRQSDSLVRLERLEAAYHELAEAMRADYPDVADLVDETLDPLGDAIDEVRTAIELTDAEIARQAADANRPLTAGEATAMFAAADEARAAADPEPFTIQPGDVVWDSYVNPAIVQAIDERTTTLLQVCGSDYGCRERRPTAAVARELAHRGRPSPDQQAWARRRAAEAPRRR